MNATEIYSNGAYLASNPTWHEEDAPWKAHHIYSMINKHALCPERVAEVGCGSGRILLELQAKLGPTVSFDGYEIASQGFALASAKANNQLHFHLKDLLVETDTGHDLLLVIDVFEHVEDYIGFLRGLRTKADFMIFHIPLDLSMFSVLRRNALIDTRKKVGHLHYFTEETALATLSDAGYKVVDSFLTARCIERRVPGLKSALAWLPRKLLSLGSKSLASKILGGYSLLVLAQPDKLETGVVH